jgi:hypothetical protein
VKLPQTLADHEGGGLLSDFVVLCVLARKITCEWSVSRQDAKNRKVAKKKGNKLSKVFFRLRVS